jgi:hypothetical protein
MINSGRDNMDEVERLAEELAQFPAGTEIQIVPDRRWPLTYGDFQRLVECAGGNVRLIWRPDYFERGTTDT